MHLQLPNTLVQSAAESVASMQEIQPEKKGVVLDRLVLNRLGRKVKFYFRQNRCKRCYSELTVEQIKALLAALNKISKGKTGDLVFDNDVYLVSPSTKRYIA